MLDEGVLTERLNVCLSSPLFCVVVLITSVRVTAVHQRRAHPIHRLPRHRGVAGQDKLSFNFSYNSISLVDGMAKIFFILERLELITTCLVPSYHLIPGVERNNIWLYDAGIEPQPAA